MVCNLQVLSVLLFFGCFAALQASPVGARNLKNNLVIQKGESVVTFDYVRCRTKLGKGKGDEQPQTVSITKTVYATETFKVRTTPTFTVTPNAVTVSALATSYATVTSTNSAITDTLTVSTTPTTTITSTATVVSTSTVNGETILSTTATSTTTVGLSPNFTPIAAQIAAQGFTPIHRRRRALPGAYSNKLPGVERRKVRNNVSQPKDVRCTETIKIVAIAVQDKPAETTATITLAPSTMTSTRTVVATTTQTVALPEISVTTTVIAPTITQSTSTTVTEVATVSNPVTAFTTATSTAYDACSTDNVISQINSNSIYSYTGVEDQLTSTTQTAPDCCETCQATNGCYFFSYGGDSSCTLGLIDVTAATCPATYDVQIYPDSSYHGLIIGNGACGQGTFTQLVNLPTP